MSDKHRNLFKKKLGDKYGIFDSYMQKKYNKLQQTSIPSPTKNVSNKVSSAPVQTNPITSGNSPYKQNTFSAPKQQQHKGNLIGGVKQNKEKNRTGVKNYNQDFAKSNNLDTRTNKQIKKGHTIGAIKFGQGAEDYENTTPGYQSKRNDGIANALWNEGKRSREDIGTYLNQYDDFRNFDENSKQNTISKIYDRMGILQGGNAGNPDKLNNQNNQNIQNNQGRGDSDYWQFIDTTIGNSFDQFNNLEDLRNVYGDEGYYNLKQQLDTAKNAYDITNPEERNKLSGHMQAIIGAYVGQKSTQSTLAGNMEATLSLLDEDSKQQAKQDIEEFQKLQGTGLNNTQIAEKMGISYDQLTQLNLLSQGNLATQLGRYYNLSDTEKARLSEKYDTQRQRMKEDYETAMSKQDRDLQRLAEDHNKTYTRQQRQNEINLGNINKLARMSGIGFSSAGIEGMQEIRTQAKNILDDLTTNYERGKTRINDIKIQLTRAYMRNDEDIVKALNEALTNAKNNYISGVAQAQAKYGLVGIEGQRAIAETTQGFIKEAQNIYLQASENTRANFQTLQQGIMNMKTMEYKDYDFQQAKKQQFMNDSLYMSQDQALNYAQEYGLLSDIDQLSQYQLQASVGYLEKQAPGLGVQFQGTIQSYLNRGYTPNEAISQVMQSREYKAMTTTATKDPNNKFLNLGNNNYYNPATGQTIYGDIIAEKGREQQEYANSPEGRIANFMNNKNKKTGDHGGQCGAFVNDYLENMGGSRIFIDPIEKKKEHINAKDPVVGAVAIMDSRLAPEYGHVAIVTSVNDDGTITVLDSNNTGDEKIGVSTMNSKNIAGYYVPKGIAEAQEYKPKETDAQIKEINNIRKEFNTQIEVKEYKKVVGMYRNVVNASKDTSGAADMSLIFAYMKILDPNSTVREGEFANAENAGGIANKTINIYNKVRKGQRLTEEMRKDFVHEATKLYKGYADGYNKTLERYQGYAIQGGDIGRIGESVEIAEEDITDNNKTEYKEYAR